MWDGPLGELARNVSNWTVTHPLPKKLAWTFDCIGCERTNPPKLHHLMKLPFRSSLQHPPFQNFPITIPIVNRWTVKTSKLARLVAVGFQSEKTVVTIGHTLPVIVNFSNEAHDRLSSPQLCASYLRTETAQNRDRYTHTFWSHGFWSRERVVVRILNTVHTYSKYQKSSQPASICFRLLLISFSPSILRFLHDLYTRRENEQVA